MVKPLFGDRGVLRLGPRSKSKVAPNSLCFKCKQPLEIIYSRDGHVETVACIGCRDVKYDRRDV